jgi:cell division protein ZapB
MPSGVCDESFSADRCGGSTGLAARPRTGFPFNPGRLKSTKAPEAVILPYGQADKNLPGWVIVFDMDKALASLEQKIRLAAELCQRLRKENQGLRQDLATSQQQLKQLNARLDTAKSRLDSVIDKIPS